MTDLLDLMGDVRAGAEEGMQSALDHADRVTPGWGNQAYAHLRRHALNHREFCTEEVRVAAHRAGLPMPPDGRAWGAVTNRAARAGMLSTDGTFRQSKVGPGHQHPARVWRSNIYREARP